jgi:hypothetical protein
METSHMLRTSVTRYRLRKSVSPQLIINLKHSKNKLKNQLYKDGKKIRKFKKYCLKAPKFVKMLKISLCLDNQFTDGCKIR